jgi:Protein of unknown function (DUF1579)
MKQKFLAICAAAFLFASCNNEKTEGETTPKDSSGMKMEKMDDNSKKEQAWIPIDSAMEQKAMMEAGALGEPHKMLAKSNGVWTAEMTYYMGIGDTAGGKMTGTQVTTSILGGHFQQSKFTGSFMGMPYEGISTVGYDNTSKEYVSTWMENMNTSIMTMRGTWDNASNSLNLTGKQKNYANGIECTMRETYKFVDDNNHVLEMYGPDNKTGKEYKMMTIKYTRKK